MRRFTELWLILLFIFGLALNSTFAGDSFRIVKLKMQSPTSIATVLRQTFGRQIRVAEAPTVNGLVLGADEPGILEQAEALIRELDKPPATLRYQIQSMSREDADLLTMGGEVNFKDKKIGLDPNVLRTRIQSRGGESKTVVGLEGQPVTIANLETRVDHLGSPWGPQDSVRTETRGLQIIGRLVGGGNEVIVEVSYSEGGFNAARQILTQLKVPLGVWFNIGDMNDSNAVKAQETGIYGAQGNSGQRRGTTSQIRNYLIRVDRVQN